MKKVLIIGESNSVMREGWTFGFAKHGQDVFSITNKSIGSTGIFNILHQLNCLGDDLSGFDYIVLDHCINDLSFFVNNQDYYFDCLAELYEKINSFGLSVVAIAFSRLKLNQRNFELYKKMTDFMRSNSDLFFDVKEYLNSNLVKFEVETLSELYSDDAHPKKEFSYLFGEFLSSELINFNFPSKIASRNASNFCVLTVDELLSACDYDIALSFISNSLVNIPALELTGDFSFKLPSSLKNKRLIGFMFNTSKSNGYVSLGSNGIEVTKPLTSNYTGREHPLLWCRPIHKEIVCSESISIKVSCEIDSEIEDMEFVNRDKSVVDFGKESFQLCSLFFR